jgi:putative addiction module component (TIGR02574 family)
MSVDLGELRKLSATEKLRIVEQLWDDIGASDEPVVVQGWHEAEGRKRAAELQANPEIALTREELWQRVDGTDAPIIRSISPLPLTTCRSRS